MAKSAPGKAFRKGISVTEAVQKYDDEAGAKAWFVPRRWLSGIACVACGSINIVPRKNNRRTPTYHCNDCKKDFTVNAGSIHA